MTSAAPDERANFKSYVAIGALLTRPDDVPLTDAEIAGAGIGAAAAAVDFLRAHLGDGAAYQAIDALLLRMPPRPVLVHDRDRS